MADLEMTPEMVREKTTSLTEEVTDQIADVQEAASAIAEMPIIDLEAEKKPAAEENSLAKFTPDEQ